MGSVQGDVIGKEFAKTTMTIAQASQIASNNITKFIGSSTTVKTGVMVFNDAIITLSENLTAVSNVILAIAAVVGSRYVSALTAATMATIIQAGVPLSTLQEMGGWESIEMVQRYAHLAPNHLTEYARQMDTIFGG